MNNELNNSDTSNNHIPLWTNNISVLFDKKYLFEIWPMENMSRSQKINAISRLVIFLTIVGYITSNNLKILVSGIVTLVILIISYYILNKKSNDLIKNKLKESFSNEAAYQKVKHNFTNPNPQNPIMNVMLPEIQDNPDRLRAAPAYNKAVKNEINESVKNIVKNNFNDENIDEKLFSDLGDNFNFEQSMRQFHVTPNTTIPNNQKEFAEFCYGNMSACKDGNVEKCIQSNSTLINM